MKKRCLPVLLFHLFIFNCQLSVAQNPGEWMWIHGSNATNAPAVFGTKGVSASGNVPRSAYEAVDWTDQNGIFWLFGGLNSAADLWKYVPAINEWTWMKGSTASFGTKGIPSATNNPPNKTYGAASWVDMQGNFWTFGGLNSSNDLWRYKPSTNEWTWMSGAQSGGTASYGTQGIPSPTNVPGPRWECVATWTDSLNNLWLFGGYNIYNDLWRYNISTNEWTWMKGSNTTGQIGVYGSMGVESPANTPGARCAYSAWTDTSGNLWTFGGTAAGSPYTYFNDLWRYNPLTNNWTWMGGLNTSGSVPGKYGTKCAPSSYNWPGQRTESRASWTDQCGNFWLFGGGIGGSFSNVWNDLWMYSPASGLWTWISGDSTSNPAGNWGTKGISSPLNKSNGRAGNLAWADKQGHIYAFGGSTTNYTPNVYNDLWKFTIDTNCVSLNCIQGISPVSVFTSSDTTFCNESGSCIDFFDHSINNPTSWKWFFPGAVPDTSTQQNPTGICYYTPGTYPVTLIVNNSNGSDSLSVSPMITFATSAAPPILYFSGDTIYCSSAAAYQWYLNGSPILNATDSFYVITGDGLYAVQITDDNGCERLSNGFPVSVNERGGIGGIRIYPNPAGNQFMIYDWRFMIGKNLLIEIYDVLGEKVLQSEITNPKSEIDISSLNKGFYFVKVSGNAGVLRMVKID